ncbi:MAG: ribonuclease R, partial [Firmicutes bacterium]|nr:ribonuclease R [Bacillota bacterium]
MDLTKKVQNYMKEEAYSPLLLAELARAIGINSEEQKELKKVLIHMEEEGLIVRTRKKRYGLPEKMNLVVGVLQGSQKGFGFLLPDDPKEKDLYIPVENLNGAMHNDKVIARITLGSIGGNKRVGEVIRVLKRGNEKVVGVFEKNKKFGFVMPDDRRIYQDIFISKDDFGKAKEGYKVVVEITKWPEGRRNPEGKVIEVLGYKDDPEIDIISIIRMHNLSEDFSSDVKKQVLKIPDEVEIKQTAGRKDLRNNLIITIDGDDAKDLDDAISLEILDNGHFLLGVHIADVSQYVFEKSPLDKEALSRGTSVYLIDRVLPMLPKELSNGICSLSPHCDRLTLSCSMEMDAKGRVIEYDIYESVINSKERMTYNDINKILECGDNELKKKYDYLLDTFKNMEKLMEVLRNKRNERGSLDFEFDETKVELDDKGKPIDIRPYVRGVSEKIIEEFMIACNETIAEHFYWKEMPFIYRVHEEPDSEKMQAFNLLIHNFGYNIKGTEDVHPKALQDILEKAKGKKEERLVNTLLLRSLKKAKYDGKNLGHFGLASRNYCHFTAPIRRYPDLMIHRIIKEDLHGKINKERAEKLQEIIPYIAIQSSVRERGADEAEREIIDLKKAQYMEDKIGEEFEGIISGITAFGMYVQLENTVEGLVHVSNMEDDYYIFDESNYLLIGERKRKVFRIGDIVKINVLSV